MIGWTVVGVALATVLGALLGERMGDGASGLVRLVGPVMLWVILVGVVLPLWEDGWGGLVLLLLAVVCLGELLGERFGCLFAVAVIVLHRFPEGMAAGIGCVHGTPGAWAACLGLVLHSVPEAMVIMPAMTEAGFSRNRAYVAAAASGASEILGLLLGASMI